MFKTRFHITEMLSSRFNRHKKVQKSPVQDLLLSNYPPTEEEITIVQKIIAETEEELQNVQITQEEYTSNPPLRRLHSHKPILSPVRRLPTEIVEEIFLHFLEDRVDPVHNSPPWTLSHICARWRRIAIGIPRLWGALPPLYLGGLQNTQARQKKIDCLTTLLTRSSTTTLSFFLSKYHQGRHSDEDILSLIFEHCERWEQISFEVSVTVCAELNAKIRGRLSSLRWLKLDIARPGIVYLDMFQVAPNLREVFLRGYTLHQEIELPWSQLTTFEEEEMVGNQFSQALLSLSAGRIQKLSFTFGKLRVRQNVLTPHITLPYLTTLTLQSFPYSGLHKFTFPALQELVLKNWWHDNFLIEVAQMIHRSSCDLRKLVMNSPKSQGREVKQILILTPSLIELDISDPELELVDDLCTVQGEHACRWLLVPSLKSLTIHLYDKLPNYAPIQRLAETRCDLLFPDHQKPKDQPSPLSAFKVAPWLALHSEADGHTYSNIQYYFEPQPGQFLWKSDGVSVIVPSIQRQLDTIVFTDNDNSTLRKGRSEAVVGLIDELVSFLEHLETSQNTIVDLYFTKAAAPLVQILMKVQIPIRRKIAFSRRVEILLVQWSSALDNYSPQLHWGWNVDKHLLYIPKNDGDLSRKLVRFTFDDWSR